MKKVRGEVNPADLFTKHLPSREKVHQLLKLFGCEYRDGRAASAPHLRPMDATNRQGGQSSGDDPLPMFSAEIDAKVHDMNKLPHMHSRQEIEELFLTVRAEPGPNSAEDHEQIFEDDMPRAFVGLEFHK